MGKVELIEFVPPIIIRAARFFEKKYSLHYLKN